MLIRMNRWEQVRQHFSEDEKRALNAAKTGEVICPRGIMIDEEALRPALRQKVRLHFPAVAGVGGGGQG